MTEVLFYHLERARCEELLPELLQKTLQRGWRSVVQFARPERLDEVSKAIWDWRDEAFIPHGTEADGFAGDQPVWLTSGDDAPNGAKVRFLLDGARCADPTGLEKLMVLFDGADEVAVNQARALWKEVVATPGLKAFYWRQGNDGRWVKQAEGGGTSAATDAGTQDA